MKERIHSSDKDRLFYFIYRLSVTADKQANGEIPLSPLPKMYSKEPKHIYRVVKTVTLTLTKKSRYYLHQKLCQLHQKQQYIPMLCRTYSVCISHLQPLFQLQATIVHHLRQSLHTTLEEYTAEALLESCRKQKSLALSFSKRDPTLPIHRQLMLKDIADEFVCFANIVTQISAVLIVEQISYQKKV